MSADPHHTYSSVHVHVWHHNTAQLLLNASGIPNMGTEGGQRKGTEASWGKGATYFMGRAAGTAHVAHGSAWEPWVRGRREELWVAERGLGQRQVEHVAVTDKGNLQVPPATHSAVVEGNDSSGEEEVNALGISVYSVECFQDLARY